MDILHRTITAHDAKTHFGDMMMKAQSAPVKVTKNGKLAVVIMSIEEFNHIQDIKQKYLDDHLMNGMEDIRHGRMLSEDDIFTGILS